MAIAVVSTKRIDIKNPSTAWDSSAAAEFKKALQAYEKASALADCDEKAVRLSRLTFTMAKLVADGYYEQALWCAWKILRCNELGKRYFEVNSKQD